MSILIAAARTSHEGYVKNLLRLGTAEAKKSVLVYAAQYGNHKIIASLLKAGADVNMTCGDNECTVLMVASLNGSERCLQNLLDAGANLNIRDITGKTALM